MSSPVKPRVPEFCRHSLYMNRISRSFLCHLLPAFNIQLEWNNDNKNYEKINSNQIQTIDQNINEFIPDLNNENSLPFETQSYYRYLPNYAVPRPYTLSDDSILDSKIPNQLESNGFEDLSHFGFAEQIEEPLLDSSETNQLIESSLITDKNIMNNNSDIFRDSIFFEPSVRYYEDFSSDYQKNKENRVKSLRSQSFYPNFFNNERNGWKPLNKTIINVSTKKKTTSETKVPQISSQLLPKASPLLPSPLPSKELSFDSINSPQKSTTVRPIVTIPSYIRRKYLFDINTKHPVNSRQNDLASLNENSKKPLKIEPKFALFKDWSKKVLNNSSDWFPSQNSKKIQSNKTQNKLIVEKLELNHSKASFVGRIGDPIEENIRKSSLRDRNQMNYKRNQIKAISEIIGNEMNMKSLGKPGIDYPIHSSSASSDFKCSEPGFFADKQFGCQVYHHCEEHEYHQKFICPNGTLFNVRIQSCDHWFNVECQHNLTDGSNNGSKQDNQSNRQMIQDLKAFVESVSKQKI